jgi:MFS family permease
VVRFWHLRAFAGSFANFGSTAGVLLAAAVSAATVSLANPERLDSWAWRVPFLLGGVIAAAGYFLRRRLRVTGYRPPPNRLCRGADLLRHPASDDHGRGAGDARRAVPKRAWLFGALQYRSRPCWGTPPVVATSLIGATGNMLAPAWFLILGAALAASAAFVMTDRSRDPLLMLLPYSRTNVPRPVRS